LLGELDEAGQFDLEVARPAVVSDAYELDKLVAG
jgi:hypothetical protein